VELIRELGKGSFGVVFQGIWWVVAVVGCVHPGQTSCVGCHTCTLPYDCSLSQQQSNTGEEARTPCQTWDTRHSYTCTHPPAPPPPCLTPPHPFPMLLLS
jgi:hypothetical protein